MRFAGEFFALLTALLWSVSALIFAAAARRISSFHVNVLRLLIAEIFFAAYLLLRPSLLTLSITQLFYLSLSGIVGLSLGDTFLFRAFQEIGARVSMLLMTLAPAIGAALAAVFLHESLGLWSIIGMGTTLAGVSLVVFERTPAGGARFAISVRGIVLGVLGAAGQGIGLILAKVAFRENPIDGFAASAVRIFAGIALLVLGAVVTRRPVFPRLKDRGTNKMLALLSIGAFFGSFLGISTSFISVTLTSVGVSSTIMATVPVLMLPLAWIVYREAIHWKAVAGACTAVAGVSLLFIQ